MLRLQQKREAKGMSKNALAALANVGHGRVGQIELRRARPPIDGRELRRLAAVLGVPVAEAGTLLDEVDDGR
jgi:transcriptional regulator with XRE-family HTH domain